MHVRSDIFPFPISVDKVEAANYQTPPPLIAFRPFTPKRDQFQTSPAASPEILHQTVWRTWLFVDYPDERWLLYTTNSHNLTRTFLLKMLGRVYFLNLGVKGLSSLCDTNRDFLARRFLLYVGAFRSCSHHKSQRSQSLKTTQLCAPHHDLHAEIWDDRLPGSPAVLLSVTVGPCYPSRSLNVKT